MTNFLLVFINVCAFPSRGYSAYMEAAYEVPQPKGKVPFFLLISAVKDFVEEMVPGTVPWKP